MNISKNENRSGYWDNIKGILILLVVFAHFLYQFRNTPCIDAAVDVIYTFHMPAFVFVSGYFGKSERTQGFEGIVKLVFLYFIFNSTMGFIYGMPSLIEPRYSFWYLLALIVWRITARRIARFREIMLVLLIIAVFAGFYDSIDNSFAAARIIAFYPYYMAGYLLTEEKSLALIRKGRTKRLLTGLGCAAAAGAMIYFALGFFEYSDNALLMYGYDQSTGAFGRIVLFVIGFTAVFALRNLAPGRNIPLLTMIGRNSLWIFILHRPITLEAEKLLRNLPVPAIIAVSAGAAVVCCAVLGCEPICGLLNRFIQSGVELFLPKTENTKRSKMSIAAGAVSVVVALGFVLTVVVNSYSSFSLGEPDDPGSTEASETDLIFQTITAEEQAAFDRAFKITFSGDLILLEDQVKRAYTGNGYDFADVFEYVKPHISSADFAIGVFEGPMASAEAGYTSSNFGDGKELYLNFPDEFAEEIKRTGFDLVTTANNHVLDKGIDGAIRTLDVLDKIGLDHTGSYRSAEEKQSERIKLVEKDGIRFAVLSYTYGTNYYDTSELAEGELSYLTSVISGTEGELFDKVKQNVERDFKEAKALDPDLIIVLPHIGTQFLNSADAEQEVWFGIFKECGADIILGDHPHVVEPVFIEEYNGKNVFTAYCPGNFANIYRKDQGDTSALIDVYIDRETKAVIGGGIVPLYTQSPIDGNFRALPIYEIEHNPKLREQLSTDDYERAKDAHSIVTKVMLGNKTNITSVTESYLFDERGFLRQKVGGLEITDEMRTGTLYAALDRTQLVCFLGDSLTEGTKNGGCPWYEPIEEHLGSKEILNFSKGGCTISYLTEHLDDIPAAELYVIAIGTNDVRYRDESVCAMTAADFTSRADELKNGLLRKAPSAEIVFIAPWYSIDGDIYCGLPFADKTALNDEYSDALEEYCLENSLGFINANPYIRERLSAAPDSRYLLDHIHPNASAGVIMYSEAVLSR